MEKSKQKKYDFFMEIWNERDHVSEISGKPLFYPNHPQFTWQFLHLLGHGAYPEYKFRKDNIILGLPSEHEKQESFEIFRERQQEMKEKYYQEKKQKLI